MSFDHDWTVRFADTDPFGIAHYPQIVVAIHDVSDRFVEEIGYPFWELSGDHGIGLPIVEVNAQFHTAMRAGDVVSISLTPSLGDRSVRFDYEGQLPDGTVAFTAYEQRACVAIGGDRAIALPDYLREAMEPYAEDEE